MSPEQMYGEKDVDHRADIWAIGIILYEALAGVRPTQGENIGQVLKLVTTDAMVPLKQRVPTVPERVADLVARMLDRDRGRRPGDLHEVCDALHAYTDESVLPFGPPVRVALTPPEPLSSGEPPSPYATTLTEEAAKRASVAAMPERRAKNPLAVVILGIAAISGGTVWMLARARGSAATESAAPQRVSAATYASSVGPAMPSEETATEAARQGATLTPSPSISTAVEGPATKADPDGGRATGARAPAHAPERRPTTTGAAKVAPPATSAPAAPVTSAKQVDLGSYL
jgi:serine/threonine-protein kinase